MAALAFKALSYGAEQIPDKFFEKIPGGFFTPQEQKEIERERKQRKGKEGRTRHRSEDPYNKRSSRRALSPETQYSGVSEDSDYEREYERRKRERRRAKSTGRTSSRSLSRGRRHRHSSDLDGQHSDSRETMAQPDQRQQPYFPPPPTSEYKPYNPQEYAPGPTAGQEYRSSATPSYGYSPQAAPSPPSGVSLDYGQYDAPRGHSRYTSSPVYNTTAHPSGADGPIPPPPVGSNSPLNPYHHTDFPPPGAGYQPSPPPFTRQRSNSQPSVGPMPSGSYSDYAPHVARDEMVQYAPPPTDPYRSHRQRHKNRARSADSHSHRSRSSKDHGRDDSRMTKVRDRFDSMDLREKGLAASVGGALAGGFAGRSLGKSRLTTLAGAAAGALGARQLATRSRSRSDRRSASRSRSRSRARTHDRERSKGPGLRARSRSVIDRFRSKSRGGEDRDSRRDDRRDDRRDRRPDHGYDYGRDEDSYDYFSSSSEGDGSPVKTRRRRRNY